MQDDDELLTPSESAAYLKIHIDSVRRLLRSGKLPGVKVGGGWRIPRSALNAMLAGRPGERESGPVDKHRRTSHGRR